MKGETTHSQLVSGQMEELGHLVEDALADHHPLGASKPAESRAGDAISLAATPSSSQVGDVVSIVHMEHSSVMIYVYKCISEYAKSLNGFFSFSYLSMTDWDKSKLFPALEYN